MKYVVGMEEGQEMLTNIDHAVIVVRDLAQAVQDYTALGFTVTPGGTHADGATRNALIAFADGSYLELLAFTAPEQPGDHPWRPRLDEGEGLEDFALFSDNLPADAERWRAANSAVVGPLDGGRVRPDGQQLQWRTARIARTTRDSAEPFVIEDVTPRGLRVPSGAATEHPLGVTGLAGVIVATRDPQALAHDYMALLDTSPSYLPSGNLRFTLSDQWIILAGVGDEAAIADAVARHGEGPYALRLTRHDELPERESVILNQDLTHGARLEITP